MKKPNDVGDGDGGGGGSVNRKPDHRADSNPTATGDAQVMVENISDELDAAYFDSYADFGVHQKMLNDEVRTKAYSGAILKYRHLIKGKVVLDVGCGMGNLSILCARAGASRVYAVEASNIADQALKVVEANKLSHIIKVLHQRIEDVVLEDKVDVLVSEWMGYMLIFENMLECVITARDKWLKPGGLILPTHATLYMAPITHPERYKDTIDFWRDVSGIDMSAVIPLVKEWAFEKPKVEPISAENLISNPHVVKRFDCRTVTVDDVVSVSTKFKIKTKGSGALLHGFAFWFDVTFDTSNGPTQTHVVFSTGPSDLPTLWGQTIMYLFDPADVEEGKHIKGSLTLTHGEESHRDLKIRLEYSVGVGGPSLVREAVFT